MMEYIRSFGLFKINPCVRKCRFYFTKICRFTFTKKWRFKVTHYNGRNLHLENRPSPRYPQPLSKLPSTSPNASNFIHPNAFSSLKHPFFEKYRIFVFDTPHLGPIIVTMKWFNGMSAGGVDFSITEWCLDLWVNKKSQSHLWMTWKPNTKESTTSIPSFLLIWLVEMRTFTRMCWERF